MPHALDEGVQVLVYDIWGTSEQFIGYAIWSWGFVACQMLHGVPKCSAGGDQVPGVQVAVSLLLGATCTGYVSHAILWCFVCIPWVVSVHICCVFTCFALLG